jgi:uncharacterized repeat protein (TIGR04076 family)
MAFKVRARFIGFFSDEEKYPCHFDYKIGEDIYYDGGKFEGRICPGLINTLIPVLKTMVDSGTTHYQRMLFRKHGGPSVRDPSMKEHDGIGFRALDKPPDDLEKKFFSPIDQGLVVCCEDVRTLAAFKVEPIDLADGGFYLSDYKRQMEILEKIKAEPGLTADGIMSKFSNYEKNLYPRLNMAFVQLALEEMATVNYIELRDGKAFPRKSRKNNP